MAVLLVGDFSEELDGGGRKGRVVGLEAVDDLVLPVFDGDGIDFGEDVEDTEAEAFHVVVLTLEETPDEVFGFAD